MIRGTTKSGFSFELSDDLFDDFEMVEAFAKYNENPLYLGALVEKLLGAKQKAALVEHLRDENGRVRTSDIIKAVTDIEEAIPAAKNSLPSPT